MCVCAQRKISRCRLRRFPVSQITAASHSPSRTARHVQSYTDITPKPVSLQEHLIRQAPKTYSDGILIIINNNKSDYYYWDYCRWCVIAFMFFIFLFFSWQIAPEVAVNSGSLNCPSMAVEPPGGEAGGTL